MQGALIPTFWPRQAVWYEECKGKVLSVWFVASVIGYMSITENVFCIRIDDSSGLP